MSDHMTAEQMVSAIKGACDTIRRLQKSARRSKSNRNSAFVKSHDLDYLSVELHWLDEVAARLSGMAAVPALSTQELRDLQRFAECCDDDEDHDVPSERMKRLAIIGVVRSCGFGRHETTEFGDSILGAAPEPPHV